MKKIISFLLAISMFMGASNAQVSKIILQASGLTCSMCSNAINKSLSTLPFISNVKSNIKESTFEITVKPGQKVDFSQIKKKVEDAGFFVAGLQAQINLGNVAIAQDTHIDFESMTFHFVNVKASNLKGETIVRFLDKGYVTAKEFKKNSSMTDMNCFKTGKIGTCCNRKHDNTLTSLYHVTL